MSLFSFLLQAILNTKLQYCFIKQVGLVLQLVELDSFDAAGAVGGVRLDLLAPLGRRPDEGLQDLVGVGRRPLEDLDDGKDLYNLKLIIDLELVS